MEDSYTHPVLGTLLAEDTDWIVPKATVPFSGRPIEVCLAGEEEASAPSEAALDGFIWISAHWPAVLQLIEGQAFDFYEPYRDAVEGVPVFETPNAIWGSEILESLHIWTKDEFTLSCRFTWQEAEDPHLVTFYVEDGRCQTHSVDG